jgi:hypothetical protein
MVTPIRDRRPVPARRFAILAGIESRAVTLPPPGRLFGALTGTFALRPTPARIAALARFTRQAPEQEILAKTKLLPWLRRRCFTVCLITGLAGGITSPRGPVGPVGPLGPVPPVTPEGPVGPLGPLTPLGPVAPVAPVGPEVPISGATAWPDISKALVTGSVLAWI